MAHILILPLIDYLQYKIYRKENMVTINNSNFANFIEINEQELSHKDINTTVNTETSPEQTNLVDYQEKISTSFLQASFISSKLQQALVPQSNVDNHSNQKEISASSPEISKAETFETNKAKTAVEESKLPQYKAAVDKEPIVVNGKLVPANEAYSYYESLVEERGGTINREPNQINIVAIRDYVNGKPQNGKLITSDTDKQRISGVTPENGGKINSTLVLLYTDKQNKRHVEYVPANFDPAKNSPKENSKGFGHVGEGNYEYILDKHNGIAPEGGHGVYDALRPVEGKPLTIIRDKYVGNGQFEGNIDEKEINQPEISLDRTFKIHYGGNRLDRTNFSAGCLVVPVKENYQRFINLTKQDPNKHFNVSVIDSSRLNDFEAVEREGQKNINWQ